MDSDLKEARLKREEFVKWLLVGCTALATQKWIAAVFLYTFPPGDVLASLYAWSGILGFCISIYALTSFYYFTPNDIKQYYEFSKVQKKIMEGEALCHSLDINDISKRRMAVQQLYSSRR